jgi:hypothetical protein
VELITTGVDMKIYNQPSVDDLSIIGNEELSHKKKYNRNTAADYFTISDML